MTITPKPMTLAQVSQSLRNRAKTIRESEDYVEGIYDRMADWFDVRADAIDAELAKQREAEPRAWTLQFPNSVSINAATTYGTKEDANRYADLCAYTYIPRADGGVDNVRDESKRPVVVPLYTHPKQHNAAEVSAEDVSVAAKAIADVIGHGMREKCEDMARVALSAVASRDSVFLVEVARIADDYVPTNEKDCALALGEMREALKCAIDAVNHQQCNAVSADRDAYEGAREELLDWKGRAQRAEAKLRSLGYTGVDASEPPAVASRDREDAERYRWLRGHSIFCNDSMHEIWFDKSNDRGDVEGFDAAIDAARRENKS